MKFYYIFIALILFVSCNSADNNKSVVTTGVNLDGFEQEKLPNGLLKVVKYDEGRVPLITGMLKNGVKNGVWTTNWPENGRIKTMATYIDGKKNGLWIEYSNRGQIKKKSNYIDDVLNGYEAAYQFGRTEMLCHYKDGVYDGDFKEYFKSGPKAGNIEKLVQYKEGKQHGRLAYFNEDGVVVMEYLYENGEKISGGIIK